MRVNGGKSSLYSAVSIAITVMTNAVISESNNRRRDDTSNRLHAAG